MRQRTTARPGFCADASSRNATSGCRNSGSSRPASMRSRRKPAVGSASRLGATPRARTSAARPARIRPGSREAPARGGRQARRRRVGRREERRTGASLRPGGFAVTGASVAAPAAKRGRSSRQAGARERERRLRAGAEPGRDIRVFIRSIQSPSSSGPPFARPGLDNFVAVVRRHPHGAGRSDAASGLPAGRVARPAADRLMVK